MICRLITPISAFVFTWHVKSMRLCVYVLCVYVQISLPSLVKTHVIGFRAHLKPKISSSPDPSLNHICKDPFSK